MKIAILVEHPEHVCCRYRIWPFTQRLAERGFQFTVLPLPSAFLPRWRCLGTLQAFDAVIVQRCLLNAWELRLLRRSARRLIFDYDDAIWLRDSYSAKGFHSQKRSGRFRRMVRAADLLFAGNAYLADEAKRIHPGARVQVVPTCVDPEQYPLAIHEPKPELRLAWVGSASTLQGLDRFREVLDWIGQRVPGLRLRLICDRFLHFEHLPVEQVPWSETTEAQHLAECDIGISWIPDDPWSRGKCGLKILQYQAAGLPVVTNPVGVHPEMLATGSGLLACTTDEWLSAIQQLQHDVALRAKMGALGRAHVEAHYSVTVGVKLWEQALTGKQIAT